MDELDPESYGPRRNATGLDFAARVQNLFGAIFSYHFERKPIISERKTPFVNYAGVRFQKAGASPFALLIKEGNICEPTAVEILVKNGRKQEIDDTDLESVILSVREEIANGFSSPRFARRLKLVISYVVLYFKDSPNAFRRLRRRGKPPEKIREGGARLDSPSRRGWGAEPIKTAKEL